MKDYHFRFHSTDPHRQENIFKKWTVYVKIFLARRAARAIHVSNMVIESLLEQSNRTSFSQLELRTDMYF